MMKLLSKLTPKDDTLKSRSGSGGRVTAKNIENPNNPKHLVHVTIDKETGEIKVRKLYTLLTVC